MRDYKIITGLKAPSPREPRRTSLPRLIELARRMEVGDAVLLRMCEANQLRTVLLALGYECVNDAHQASDKTKVLVFKLAGRRASAEASRTENPSSEPSGHLPANSPQLMQNTTNESVIPAQFMPRTSFVSHHWSTPEGVPAGGVSYGTGFAVSWQNGPLGRDAERKAPNGAFVETLLEVVADRLDYYQGSKFACDENHNALIHIGRAIDCLRSRTAKREARNVEGTSEV